MCVLAHPAVWLNKSGNYRPAHYDEMMAVPWWIHWSGAYVIRYAAMYYPYRLCSFQHWKLCVISREISAIMRKVMPGQQNIIHNNWYPEKPSLGKATLIARFMGPTWGPSGTDRTQVGPMLAPWTLLSGYVILGQQCVCRWSCTMRINACHLQRQRSSGD